MPSDADAEQRPLQRFGSRRVGAEMVEQRQVRQRPERDQCGPVGENAAERNPRRPARRVRRARVGFGRQRMSVRHDCAALFGVSCRKIRLAERADNSGSIPEAVALG